MVAAKTPIENKCSTALRERKLKFSPPYLIKTKNKYSPDKGTTTVL